MGAESRNKALVWINVDGSRHSAERRCGALRCRERASQPATVCDVRRWSVLPLGVDRGVPTPSAPADRQDPLPIFRCPGNASMLRRVFLDHLITHGQSAIIPPTPRMARLGARNSRSVPRPTMSFCRLDAGLVQVLIRLVQMLLRQVQLSLRHVWPSNPLPHEMVERVLLSPDLSGVIISQLCNSLDPSDAWPSAAPAASCGR